MNARLKLLAEQCTYQIYDSRSGLSGKFDKEKFAELFVRECIDALWTEECNISDLALEEYNRNINKIIKHFGVEE